MQSGREPCADPAEREEVRDSVSDFEDVEYQKRILAGMEGEEQGPRVVWIRRESEYLWKR